MIPQLQCSLTSASVFPQLQCSLRPSGSSTPVLPQISYSLGISTPSGLYSRWLSAHSGLLPPQPQCSLRHHIPLALVLPQPYCSLGPCASQARHYCEQISSQLVGQQPSCFGGGGHQVYQGTHLGALTHLNPVAFISQPPETFSNVPRWRDSKALGSRWPQETEMPSLS